MKEISSLAIPLLSTAFVSQKFFDISNEYQ